VAAARRRKGIVMTRKLLVGLACLSMANAHGAGNAIAPVTAVVLFPGGATVTRSAPVTPTMMSIEIPGLPTGFDIQTLRADADAGVRIGQIVIKDAGDTEAINPAEAALNEKVQALRDQDAALDAEFRAADIVRAYLERFGGADTATHEHTHSAIDARTLAGLIDTIGRGAGDALARMQRIAVQKRENGKKIEALQRDLAHVRTGATDRRTLTVNFVAERAGTLRISYQVPQAGWKPAYRATLDGENSKVSLERLATVSQKTGEDWINVSLRLSTNQPRLSPQAPEPQPWLLSYVPPRPAAAEPRAYMAAAAPAAAPMQALKVAGDSYQPPTFESQSTYATEFEVPSRVSLATDGREMTVPLATQLLPVKQRLRVVPRLDKAAIVTAEAGRPEGVWPSGNMQLFRDGQYVGATEWNPQSADHFVLSFGRDELVRVSVDPVKGQSGSTGIFERRSERRITDQFTLTSAHKRPVDVLLLESSPVSSSDEIKVKASFEPKPTTEAWEKRQGVVAWETTLAPKASATFTVDYVIDYPREGWVSGMH
jgi:uncharacterized protein (TIGR02231 family)